MINVTTNNALRIFVGFDADEMMACTIAVESLRRQSQSSVNINRISRLSLTPNYLRPTERRDDGRLWDLISGAPMSTDHAIARFFVPWLCDYQGWALFVDGDVLCRRDISELFALADDRYAVMCVQHPPLLEEGLKKDGAIQTSYARKNWSSVMLLNCGHWANQKLTLDVVNTWAGRDLHAFSWLNREEIGWLPPEWNYLVGVNAPLPDPAIVHYTLGLPTLPQQADAPFAGEWWEIARRCGYQVPAAIALEQIALG